MSKKKIIIIGCTVLVIVVCVVVACILLLPKNKQGETPFFEKYEFTVVSPKDPVEVPVYSFAANKDGNEITVDGVSFIQKNMVYTFRDAEVSEPEENGNVEWKLTYDQKVDLEFIDSGNSSNWYYTYTCSPFSIFDYYTGDIYRKRSISGKNSTKVLTEGLNANDVTNKEMAYTDVTFNGKTTKIGILVEHLTYKWEDPQLIEETNEGRRYIATCNSGTTVHILAPKDYDGLMLFINKNGVTKEDNDRDVENYNKLVALQKEAQEKGEKSEELIELEEKKNVVHKIIDSNDEERKDRKPEDYYVIKVSDFIKAE